MHANLLQFVQIYIWCILQSVEAGVGEGKNKHQSSYVAAPLESRSGNIHTLRGVSQWGLRSVGVHNGQCIEYSAQWAVAVLWASAHGTVHSGQAVKSPRRHLDSLPALARWKANDDDDDDLMYGHEEQDNGHCGDSANFWLK